MRYNNDTNVGCQVDLDFPGDKDVLGDLSDEIEGNAITLATIRLPPGAFHGDEGTEFFRTVGSKLPNLASVSIVTSNSGERSPKGCDFSILALGELLLQRADTLVKIETKGINWNRKGSGVKQRDLDNMISRLSHRLKEVGKLQRVQMHGFCYSPKTLLFLNSVANSCVTIREMTILKYSGGSCFNLKKDISLGHYMVHIRRMPVYEGVVCNSPLNVRHLTLADLHRMGASFNVVINAIQSKESKLTELNLVRCGNKLTFGMAIRLLEALEHNQIMETLELKLGMGSSDEFSRIGVALEKLAALKRLRLYTQCDFPIPPILQGLGKNRCLQQVYLSTWGPTSHLYGQNQEGLFRGLKKVIADPNEAQAIIHEIKKYELSLETNLTLKELSIDWKGRRLPVLSEQGQLWLKLNQLGRMDLLKCEDANNWINVIIEERHDLSITFYLLSEEPSLISSRTQVNSVTVGKRQREGNYQGKKRMCFSL